MQKKKTFSPKPTLFVAIAAVAIVLVGFIVNHFSKGAELILAIAPSTARVELDGRKISSGCSRIRPGAHELIISGEELESKTINFEISRGQTYSLLVYITSGDDFSYYLKNADEIDRLALVADDAAKEFILNYRKAEGILSLLPLVVANDDASESSTLSRGEECERSYCLEIVDENADMKNQMLKKIKELGYDPEDYEIKYERRDSVEEDSEE